MPSTPTAIRISEPRIRTSKSESESEPNGAEMGKNVMGQVMCAMHRAWEDRYDRLVRSVRADRGMTTSEYAVGTIAACAFAAVLYKVVTSGAVQSALQSLIKDALDAKF